jgi:hypothetical protein
VGEKLVGFLLGDAVVEDDADDLLAPAELEAGFAAISFEKAQGLISGEDLSQSVPESLTPGYDQDCTVTRGFRHPPSSSVTDVCQEYTPSSKTATRGGAGENPFPFRFPIPFPMRRDVEEDRTRTYSRLST